MSLDQKISATRIRIKNREKRIKELEKSISFKERRLRENR